MEFVTRSDRPDLDDQVREAFRVKWPEFIFHDPVAHEYGQKVETYFADLDVLLLDEGRAVAGGWGVPVSSAGPSGATRPESRRTP